jgi:hypothetical protein
MPAVWLVIPQVDHVPWQELMRNEEAEAEELRAFRYTFRSVLAGPLLSVRSVIK